MIKRLLLLGVVCITSCLGAALMPEDVRPAKPCPNAISSHDFAIQLAEQLLKKAPSDNFFISPHNIASAFSMVYAGSKGDTEKQMREFFGFRTNSLYGHLQLKQLNSYLTQEAATGSFWESLAVALRFQEEDSTKLALAHSLWIDRYFDLLPDYSEVMSKAYDAQVFERNFSRHAEDVRQEINGWVEEQTYDKIKDMLSDLDPSTAAVLISTLYFKGDWDKAFDPKLTEQKTFHLTPSSKKQVAMMSQEEEHKLYIGQEFSIVELPYQANEGDPRKLALWVLLPHDNDGLADMLEHLEPSDISEWKRKMRPYPVKVHLPSFEQSTSLDLKKALSALGLTLPFSEKKADFSGIASDSNFVIEDALHKTWIKVNEEGAEAAAATAVQIRLTSTTAVGSDEPYFFNADHPFLFLLIETETETLLGLGAVQNPEN